MNPHVQEVSKQVMTRTSRQSTRTASPSIISARPSVSTARPSIKANPQTNSPSSSGVSISISDEGLKMAQTMTNSAPKQAAEAKVLLSHIETAVKANPQDYKDIHSNLRSLRINHLLYD